MDRNRINYAIDGLTALAALNLVFTGFLIELVMPPGSGHERLTLLGMDRHDWGRIHFWTALACVGLVLIHVCLHWRWICTMSCRIATGKTGHAPSARARHAAGTIAVVLIVGLIAGLLALAQANLVRAPRGDAAREGRPERRLEAPRRGSIEDRHERPRRRRAPRTE